MAVTRRQFLLAGAAVATGGCALEPEPAPLFLSAATDVQGNHCAAGFDAAGELVFRTPIAFRGHELVVAPDRRSAVVIARRPGNQLVRIRLDDGSAIHQKASAADRHFYGHGVYTGDGKFLLTTENDFERGKGVIAVRDAETFNVVDEFDSHGVGPHELRWLEDKQTLAVANGGIATHPEYGRSKLNTGAMQPNLAFVDGTNGMLRQIIEPNDRQNSIRHIDVLPGDRVVIAMQQEGGPGADTPLVAVGDRAAGMRSLEMPAADLRELRQYTASVCIDRATGHGIATCPRGNRITFWDMNAGTYRGAERIADAAGVCVDELAAEFVVTSGRGTIHRFDTRSFELKTKKTTRVTGLSWDNHLSAV